MSENDAFLKAIRATPNDLATRLVYADWLDEHGHGGGAFLRAECEWYDLPPGPQKDECFARLQEAGGDLESDWLAAVSRVPIENCGLRFQFRCPNRWELLKVTSDESVRYCGACRKNVYFCETIDEAKEHAANRHCVAVDARLSRTPNDLLPWHEMLTVGFIMPERTRDLLPVRLIPEEEEVTGESV
jgi:uncharacterized protein (TIGR02996 family)